MKIVGCDFHPSWQQIAVFDGETGELTERKLVNGDGEAERFYRGLEAPALVGVEACGNNQWLLDMLERLGHQVWVGDAAQIRASYVRRQKTDRRDAGHILKLLLEGRFPRLWMPSAAERDLRQLLIHRHKLVEIRTRVKNGLQHLMLNRGVQQKSRLWSVRGRADLEQLFTVWLGGAATYRPAAVAGGVGAADRGAGPSGRTGSGGAPAGAAADDAAGRRCGDVAGLCAQCR